MIDFEYGGAGMDYVSLGLAGEELEYVETSLRVVLSVHVGLNGLSLLASSDLEKKKQRDPSELSAFLLWLRSGRLKNNGRRNTRETGPAKWFATVASERAAGDAVQVRGANGYSRSTN